jgi:hypothetical protein
MWKPSAAVLAALGAMSIVRAAFGALEGTSWLDVELGRVGLVALALVGAFAIYTAGGSCALAGRGRICG